MGNFHAYEFIFDGVPSHMYDLKITSFDDTGVSSGVGSSNVDILSQTVLRKSKAYYLGRTQHTVLEFSLTFGRAAPISGMDRDLISKWLFGRSGYKKLEILQDDLNGAYFNCFLTNPEPVYVGNVNYGFNCTIVCDSPWAYTYEKVVSGTIGATGSAVFTIHNDSSEDDYLYPNLVLVSGNGSGSWISITNASDSNREFRLTDISPTYTINVNNDLQILSTSTSALILDKFNKNWFRLKPRANEITIVAEEDATYSISRTERIKIGG